MGQCSGMSLDTQELLPILRWQHTRGSYANRSSARPDLHDPAAEVSAPMFVRELPSFKERDSRYPARPGRAGLTRGDKHGAPERSAVWWMAGDRSAALCWEDPEPGIPVSHESDLALQRQGLLRGRRRGRGHAVGVAATHD